MANFEDVQDDTCIMEWNMCVICDTISDLIVSSGSKEETRS